MTAVVAVPNLPAVPTLSAAAIFYVVQGGVSYRCTAAEIAAIVASLPGNEGIVENKTADYTITPSDSRKTFTNLGAAGTVILEMPTPFVGLQYNFLVEAAQTLVLDVGGSVVVALGEIVSAPGDQISSNTPYSFLTLKCLTTTLWGALSMGGSWSAS